LNIDIERIITSFAPMYASKGSAIRRFWYTWRCCG